MRHHLVPHRLGIVAAAVVSASALIATVVNQSPAAYAQLAPRVVIDGSTVLDGTPGSLPLASGQVSIELTLAARDPARLDRALRDVTTPGGSAYRRYLAKGQFARRFGETASTTARLRAYLRSSGLHDIRLEPDGLMLSATGSPLAIARAFDTKIVRTHDRLGRPFTTNDGPMSLPRLVAPDVTGVLGLDAPLVATPSFRRIRQAVSTNVATTPVPVPNTTCAGAITRNAVTHPGGAVTTNAIAAIYGLLPLYATGDFGAGRTIALVEFSNLPRADVETFARCVGIVSHVVVVRVGSGRRSTDPGALEEAEIDVEDVIGLAPDARVLVYEGTNQDLQVDESNVYARIVNDDRAQVISTSWGSCERSLTAAEMRAENLIFKQAALQGQTVVAASGDTGSEDCLGTLGGAAGRALGVDDPASQPYVTGVGGTTFVPGSSASGQPVGETVWNADGSAGGGGLSSHWPMPAYQRNAAPTLGVITAAAGPCRFTRRCREVPDISADAGTPYAFYCTVPLGACDSGGWTGFTGTSAAAPTIAALFALADASSACITTGPVGFVNPLLYEIASGSGYAAAFNDVTTGTNNLLASHVGAYDAGPGYDLATGLGTPNAGSGSDTGLVTALCSSAVRAAAGAAPAIARVDGGARGR